MALRSDTSPKIGDSDNILLAKIAQATAAGGGSGTPNTEWDHVEFLPNGMVRQSLGTLAYAASVNLDFGAEVYQTLTLAGNVTFTTSNLTAVTSMAIRIVADGSDRTLTFPAGWTFLTSAAPTEIAAGKTAILSLTSFGTSDANVVAAYAVEP